jgi:putative copper export protein
LPQGGYEVHWTAISTTDGYTTSGLIGFNLGQSSLGAGGTPLLGPSTSNYFPQLSLQGILSIAWNWLSLLALFGWIGILVTNYIIVPRATPVALVVQVRRHSRSLQTLCLLAILVGEVINLVLRGASLTATQGNGGIDVNTITQLVLATNYGHLWLLRMGLLVLALIFLWWFSYRQDQPPNTAALPTNQSGKANSRFTQIRQQVRMEYAQESTTLTSASMPVRAHTQARITGAVVATNVSPPRGTTASFSKLAGKGRMTEAESTVHEPRAWYIVSWLVLAGLIMLTLALSNEIIQLTPLPISTVVITWLALAAQAVWFGCIGYLGLILLPLLPTIDPDRHTEDLLLILKQATPLLLSAIGIQVVSNLFIGEATIQVPGQLLTDPYGRAYLVRALLLMLMIIFTVYLLFFLVPSLQRQTVLLPVVDAELPARRTRQRTLNRTESTIKRALHALTALAAATLICLSLMDFFAPPVVFPNIQYTNPPLPAGQSSATGTTQTQKAGGLSVSLRVLPARAGVTNTVTLSLVNSQGQLVSNARVILTINMEIMDMGITNKTISSGSPTYIATFQANQAFAMAGTWNMQVEIDLPNQPPLHLTFQIPIN